MPEPCCGSACTQTKSEDSNSNKGGCTKCNCGPNCKCCSGDGSIDTKSSFKIVGRSCRGPFTLINAAVKGTKSHLNNAGIYMKSSSSYFVLKEIALRAGYN